MDSIWRTASRSHRLPRRRFLQAGLASSLGGFLPIASSPAAASEPVRAKRCLVVFLNGGPSQLDTWDMKPDAPAEIRGELKPIATTVPGLQVSELLPNMARLAHRYKVVRSVAHTASVHTTGVYTMLTGTHHRTPLIDQNRIEPDDHPHLGAIYSTIRPPNGSPPFVCLPTLFRAPPVEGIWPGQTAGFLGRRLDPLLVVMSEFGRTPRINKDAGRDHWPDSQSILLAGAGISGGTIYGATDRNAALVTTNPVTPPDLGQTILHLLGVPRNLALQDPQGRLVPASRGEVLHDLIA